MSLHNEIDEMIQEDPRNATELPVYVKFIEDFSVGFYGLKNRFWKKFPGAFAWAKAQAFYRCLTREKNYHKNKVSTRHPQYWYRKPRKRLTVNVYSKALVPINSRMVGQQVFAFFFSRTRGIDQDKRSWTGFWISSNYETMISSI